MNNNNENEPPPIEYTGPKGLPTKETWEKCSLESALFNEIRYHSYPFAAPPQPVIKKNNNHDSRLEKALEKKFRSGRHRHSNYLTSLGAWIQPGFLFLVMPFYLVFYVFPSWIKQMAKWFWKRVALLFTPIKTSVLARVKSIQVGLKNRIDQVANAKKQLRSTFQSKLTAVSTSIRKGYGSTRNRLGAILKFISDLRNIIFRPFVVLSNMQRSFLNIFRPLHLAKEKITLSIDSKMKNINERYLLITKKFLRVKQRLLQTIQPIIDFPKNCLEKTQLLFNRFHERSIRLTKKLLQGPKTVGQEINSVILKGRAHLHHQVSSTYKKISGSFISIVKPMISKVERTTDSISRFFDPIRKFFAKHTKSVKAFRQEIRGRLVELPHLVKTNASAYILKAIKFLTEIINPSKMETQQSESEGTLKLLPKPIRNRVTEIKQAVFIMTNPITSFVRDTKAKFKKQYQSMVLNLYYLRLWRRVLLRYGMEVARAKANAIYQNLTRLPGN